MRYISDWLHAQDTNPIYDLTREIKEQQNPKSNAVVKIQKWLFLLLVVYLLLEMLWRIVEKVKYLQARQRLFIYIVLEAQSTCKSNFDGCFGNIK